jgi:hypothetical protein
MRKLLGVVSICFGISMTDKGLKYFFKALQLVGTKDEVPFKSLYTEEYFLTFGFMLITAAFAFRWGFRQFRKRQTEQAGTDETLNSE